MAATAHLFTTRINSKTTGRKVVVRIVAVTTNLVTRVINNVVAHRVVRKLQLVIDRRINDRTNNDRINNDQTDLVELRQASEVR